MSPQMHTSSVLWPQVIAPSHDTTPAMPWKVTLQPALLTFNAAAPHSVLQAAEAAGIELPSSCRNGTCRTCLCHLHSGTVAYAIEWPGVSAEEVAEGYFLPCVASATSDLVVDQPLARLLFKDEVSTC